ncbi:MAG: hypothetical protein WC655_26520 [Candidatus Hydrogenedentales bacterium]
MTTARDQAVSQEPPQEMDSAGASDESVESEQAEDTGESESEGVGE